MNKEGSYGIKKNNFVFFFKSQKLLSSKLYLGLKILIIIKYQYKFGLHSAGLTENLTQIKKHILRNRN